MVDILSSAQIEKYAARLQGQKLLPVLREWQLKRAIRLLAIDGTQPSLDAIKRGVEKGLLRTSAGQDLLESVLGQAVVPLAAKRVRAHLKPPEPVKPAPSPPQGNWSSGVGRAAVAQPEPEPAPKSEPEAEPQPQHQTENFSSTTNSIQLLQQYLNTDKSIISYRDELRECVRRDGNRALLQEICELWDRSGGKQRETLRELIEFIELVPERPLWLRRNVALDCGMPWQLADDSPSIVQHLISTTQLRTRKKAVLGAIRKLRREDTKAEVCELWFEQHKRGVHDSDFDDILLQLGFLPKNPLEQRVAIALTCSWAERLAFDDREVLAYLLPLLDDPRLGDEARRALDNIKNPATLKALKEQRQTEAGKEDEKDDSLLQKVEDTQDSETETKNAGIPDDSEDGSTSPYGAFTPARERTIGGKEDVPIGINLAESDQQGSTSNNQVRQESSLERSVDTVQVADIEKEDYEVSIQAGETGAGDQSSTLDKDTFGRPIPSPYLDFKRDSTADEDLDEISLAAGSWDDEGDSDTQWISRLDRFAGLAPDERQRIISQTVCANPGDDDWILELLSDNYEYSDDQLESQQEYERLERRTNQIVNQQDSTGKRPGSPSEATSEDKIAKLSRCLEIEGFSIREANQFAVIYAFKSGKQVEISKIELDELADFTESELDEYTRCCLKEAQELGCKVSYNNESSTASDQGYIASSGDSARPLEVLFLKDLVQGQLDSASIFLIECASKLISSRDSHHLAPFTELIAGLLTFHTRERNAEIQAYDEHMEMNEDALRNDSDCIAGAILEEIVPYNEKLFAARYRFDPQQPFRFTTRKDKKRSKIICQSSRTLVELDAVEEIYGIATVLVKTENKNCLQKEANFVHVPQDFSQTLRQSLAQQAPGWISSQKPLSDAFVSFLRRFDSGEVRDLNDRIDLDPTKTAAHISDFLRKSSGVSLIIQGPPGSGKTSCAAEIISLLAQSGFKIGISANSHLAIDTLLEKTSLLARTRKQPLRLAKFQSGLSAKDREIFRRNDIRVIDNSSFNMLFDVYGGTAFAFSKSCFEDLFDLLVVDEASQVSLSSLMAMARCTKNILLVGDQQQLAQPVVANHPGESGLSCLGYATSNLQTVARGIGVFLSRSWRMHPIVCKFISHNFYEDRLLHLESNNSSQIFAIPDDSPHRNEAETCLGMLTNGSMSPIERDSANAKIAKFIDKASDDLLISDDRSLKSGLFYVPVEHRDNHIFSQEEADAIQQVCHGLIGKYCLLNLRGEKRLIKIDWNDIAIMAPFNAQVSLIQRTLGPSARVGTVDRFQGQESPVAIYSLTTSNTQNLNTIEFILNCNRVNVALSRSQCISVTIGSPSLIHTLNSSPELDKERHLFFALTKYIFSGFTISTRRSDDVELAPNAKEANINSHGIDEWFSSSSRAVPIPEGLGKPSSIKLARKLFKFNLCSEEILCLYKYRLFDELALFLDFCKWDDTEKAWEQTKLLIRLAASPNATPLLLEKLAKKGEWKTKQAVATNPNTPIYVIQDLIAHESAMGKRGAAENPALPEELYWKLAAFNDELTGRALSSNPNIPYELLIQLTESEYEITRRLAQENLLRRAECMAKLGAAINETSSTGNGYSLEAGSPLALAANPSVPSSYLSTLVSINDQKVRTALASNPSLAADDIHVLAFDLNDSIRCRIAKRLDLTPTVMRALASDQSRYVRRILAENPACSEEAFKRLVSDSDVYVREKVALQPRLSEKVCYWLLADSDPRVILALADNTSIAVSFFSDAQLQYYLDSLAGNKPNALKALLIICLSCPVQKLAGLALGKSMELRLALALSPHTNEATLRSLCEDEEKLIAKTAEMRLALL